MLTTRGNWEIYNFLLVSTGKNIVCGTYNWYEFRNKSYHLNLKELYSPSVNFQVKKKKKKKKIKKRFLSRYEGMKYIPMRTQTNFVWCIISEMTTLVLNVL